METNFEWFVQRIGREVAVKPKGAVLWQTMRVINADHATWLTEAVNIGYKFKDVEDMPEVKLKPRVHQGPPDSTCEACEG